eukprot:gene14441-14566_t
MTRLIPKGNLGIKVSGSALAILMFTLAARFMGPLQFGHFAVLFNIMSFLAVVAVLGQDTLIVRSWSEYVSTGAHGLARGAYYFGWITALLSSICVTFLVVLAARVHFIEVDHWTLFSCGLFLIAQTMLHFSSHSSRMIAGYLISETNREIIWRCLVIIAMILAFYTGQMISAAMIFLVAACGMMGGILIQSRKVQVVFPDEIRQALREHSPKEWLQRIAGMWPSAVLEAASQYVDVILIGLMVTPAEAGGYFVAFRIANVFSMISTGMMSYTSPKIGTLFYSGQSDELQQVLKRLMLITAVMVLGLCSLIVVFGHVILNIFGVAYIAEYPTLLVLACGAGVVTLCGPSPAVLLTTGHELLYSRLALAGLLTRLVLFVGLVPSYGALGAALAWSLATAPLNIVLVLACRKYVGLDPSLMGLLGKRPKNSFKPDQ